MKRSLRATLVLVALAALAACAPPQPFPSGSSGALFFPADNGARVDAMPADCLVSGAACPKPTTLSLYPEEWNVAALTWTPGGGKALVMSADQPKDHLALLTPPSRQLQRFASLAFIGETVWSPDGQLLAVAGSAERGRDGATTSEGQIEGSGITLYSAAGKELGNLAAALPGTKSDLNWLSPDSLLFQNRRSEQDCNLYLLTVSSGALAPWSEPPLCGASPAVSPDGAQVALVRDGNLWLADADGSKAAPILDLSASIAQPAWSPDGRWIAFDETESAAVGVVHPDGSGYRQVATDVRNAGFAPLAGESLLLTVTDRPHGSGDATASWYVTSIPGGQPRAVVVPGIPPDQMPLDISWRPPRQ
ncbi:MAG: hypothetical protein R2844_19935 [Caldilineales bacterium]